MVKIIEMGEGSIVVIQTKNVIPERLQTEISEKSSKILGDRCLVMLTGPDTEITVIKKPA